MQLVNSPPFTERENALQCTPKLASGLQPESIPPHYLILRTIARRSYNLPTARDIGGRDSSVGIATRYGLDGTGIESRWGVRISASVQTGPGANTPYYTMGTASFLGVEGPGRGVDTTVI